MKERVKIFNHASSEGSTVIDCELEEHINQFLANVEGRITHISQSESRRSEKVQHVTVCVWYVPGGEA